MERKARERKAPQKKKTLTFKSTPAIFDDEIDDQEDDEDLSLFVKNVRKMYNKAKFNNRRRGQGKEEKKIVCYNYRKLRHVIVDCPEIKSKPSTSKKPYKKKVLKATWDLEIASKKEVDMANVCSIANDNTPQVFS